MNNETKNETTEIQTEIVPGSIQNLEIVGTIVADKPARKKPGRKPGPPKEQVDCLCGCGTQVYGRFVRGHFRKLMSLVKVQKKDPPNEASRAFCVTKGWIQ